MWMWTTTRPSRVETFEKRPCVISNLQPEFRIGVLLERNSFGSHGYASLRELVNLVDAAFDLVQQDVDGGAVKPAFYAFPGIVKELITNSLIQGARF